MGRTTVAIAERTTELGRILGVVGDAVGLVIEHLDRVAMGETGKPQERRGGYFCLAEDTPGAPLILHARIGLVRAEKVDQYRALSHEKTVRLAGRPGDVSSYQSRDPKARVPGQPPDEEPWGQWGGAIRGSQQKPLLAFSGLPELGDEAAMLLAAVKCGVLTVDEASYICSVSSNPTYATITVELEQANTWHNGRWTVPSEYREMPGIGM